MSEEIKTEEAKEVKPKSTLVTKIVSVIVGVVVGVASMLGVNQTQINTMKTDTTEAYKEVQAVIQAIQSKDYLKAIDAAKKAADKLKNVADDAKEAVDTAKEGIETYKQQVIDLKAAVDAKDYKTVVAIASKISGDITAAVPADKLTGKTKEVYDLVVKITEDAAAQKYDPIIDTVTRLVSLFKTENEAAPATDSSVPTPESK